MHRFNDVYRDVVQEDTDYKNMSAADLRLENASLLEVLWQLRRWIGSRKDTMAMPGPQDCFGETIWHGIHVYLAYGETSWYVNWRTSKEADWTSVPMEDDSAQLPLSCIEYDALCWSIMEMCRTNSWTPPLIDLEVDLR